MNRQTYFPTYSEAVQYARRAAEVRGYEVAQDVWESEIVFHTEGRPAVGQTVSKHLPLELGPNAPAKPKRQGLEGQVYALPSGNYELNFYFWN